MKEKVSKTSKSILALMASLDGNKKNFASLLVTNCQRRKKKMRIISIEKEKDLPIKIVPPPSI